MINEIKYMYSVEALCLGEEEISSSPTYSSNIFK